METTVSQFQDPSAPECMGVMLTQPDGSTRMIPVIYSDLSDPDKLIYTDFVALLPNNRLTTISNTPSGMEITHPIAIAPDMSPAVLDYDTMSIADKNKIFVFINLLNQL